MPRAAFRSTFLRAWALSSLVERLRHNQWQGQVVGGHGSGKSALLAALVPAIERAGRQVVLIELHDAQRRLPADWRQRTDLDPADRGARLRLRAARPLEPPWAQTVPAAAADWARGDDLRPLSLPDLFRTSVSLELAQEIVESLLGVDKSLVGPGEVAQAMGATRGTSARSSSICTTCMSGAAPASPPR